MGQIVEIARDTKQDGMSESQHKDREMYRKLGVVQVFRMEGLTDEECEQKWLAHMNASGDETLYVSEPGLDREQ